MSISGALRTWLWFIGWPLLPVSLGFSAEADRPNVILLVTDDQGYGDLGCHGNPEIQTPALDQLHRESVRLTNFHVDPTCAPTRSAVMTGRYSSRTGVWHTIEGRSILRKDEATLADLFAKNGYRTGIFGKWHLGDNFPYRPQDRGFQEVLVHGGGGVGQTPDFWGNDYFDDTYWHNGTPKKFDGYCTDVFFTAATRFIESHRDRPFFAYIATNAPHSPFNVAEKYSRPYKDRGVPSPRAEFYGMITCIDDNVARLRQRIEELGLAENTLFIYMTDNGTAAGIDKQGGFNAGMRGKKGSEYEGGHRVPCFLHWPAGGLTGGRDVARLTAHIDLLPTLTELCHLKSLETQPLDGRSLVPLLKGETDWPERTLCVHSQRIEHPQKWKTCAVMTDRWRLINGKELYDLTTDPDQNENVADEHPEIVANLRAAYEEWWNSISTRFDEYVRLELGAPNANPVLLTCHDWHSERGICPWNQTMIERDPVANGVWMVDVLRDGRYKITLRNRPPGVVNPLNTATARVRVGDAESARMIASEADAVTFTFALNAGPAKLQTWLERPDGTTRGAFYVEVERIGE